MRFFDRLQPLALLVLRIALGLIMIAHGYHKLGRGLVTHYHFIQSVGLPGWLAIPSAVAEFFGGLLVLIGFFTRFAALAILVDMVVAIWKVTWKNGLVGQYGYELNLALAAIAFALVCYGSGPLALEILRKGSGTKST